MNYLLTVKEYTDEITYLNLVLDVVKEPFYSLIGLPEGSNQRELLEHRGKYAITKMAREAKESPNGYVTVKMPFSWLPKWMTFYFSRNIKYITVVCSLPMASEIANHNFEKDKYSRELFSRTEELFGIGNLTTRTSSSVPQNRRDSKKVLHNISYINAVLKEEIDGFLDRVTGKEINLKYELGKLSIRMIGRSILGIEKFPEGNPNLSMDYFLELIIALDEALATLNSFSISKLGPKLNKYTEWLRKHNQETLLGENSLLPHFLDWDISQANFAGAFVITDNIIKLVYISLIYLGCNPEWQEKLRTAFREGDEQFVGNMYKEMCRFFITTHIPRFTSKEITFQGHTFPAWTFFLLPTRNMRFDPDIYSNPQKFDPNRYLENGIKMNSIELCPFGLGPRMCISAAQYTEKFWKQVMSCFFKDKQMHLNVTSHQEMEPIPVEISFLQLDETYMGCFSPV